MIKSAAACEHVVRVSGTVGATYSSVITPTQGRESIAGIIYYTIFFLDEIYWSGDCRTCRTACYAYDLGHYFSQTIYFEAWAEMALGTLTLVTKDLLVFLVQLRMKQLGSFFLTAKLVAIKGRDCGRKAPLHRLAILAPIKIYN